MKEKINKTPLSDYEHDAMWMSYRYAIGRHTAASSMHAGHLVQANYYRLTDVQRELAVFDIRREINMRLVVSFNFGLDLYVPQEYYDPFKALLEFFAQDYMVGVDITEYLRDHTVSARYWPEGKRYLFVTEEIKEERSDKYLSHIADLVEWANAANALDTKKHYIAVTDNGNVEVFERIVIRNWKTLEIEYTPVEDYLKKPSVTTYLRKENIKELKQIEQ